MMIEIEKLTSYDFYRTAIGNNISEIQIEGYKKTISEISQ